MNKIGILLTPEYGMVLLNHCFRNFYIREISDEQKELIKNFFNFEDDDEKNQWILDTTDDILHSNDFDKEVYYDDSLWAESGYDQFLYHLMKYSETGKEFIYYRDGVYSPWEEEYVEKY